jgi:hypothetical protein
MQSVYLQRIMKKNAAKGYENSNPIKACPELVPKVRSRMGQFLCPQRHTLSYAEGAKTEVRCRFSEVIYLSSAFCFLSSVHGHQPPPTSYLPPQFSLKFTLKNAPAPLRNRCVAQEIFEKLLICTCFYSIIVLFYALYIEIHLSVDYGESAK